MFRRRWSGLPEDPFFPADLEELGYVDYLPSYLSITLQLLVSLLKTTSHAPQKGMSELHATIMIDS